MPTLAPITIGRFYFVPDERGDHVHVTVRTGDPALLGRALCGHIVVTLADWRFLATVASSRDAVETAYQMLTTSGLANIDNVIRVLRISLDGVGEPERTVEASEGRTHTDVPIVVNVSYTMRHSPFDRAFDAIASALNRISTVETSSSGEVLGALEWERGETLELAWATFVTFVDGKRVKVKLEVESP